ncbi:MAG: FkbM family methyltransferase [Hyphomicrobiaceae bacterium]
MFFQGNRGRGLLSIGNYVTNRLTYAGQHMQNLTIAEIGALSRADAEVAIRSRVQTVYLGDDRVLTRILGSLKLFLSTKDTGFGCHVMLDGFWEMWLTQFFARIVKPGMTVVDVGANFGYYSVLFGEAVGPGGQVIAIEPVPVTAGFLRRSVDLNGHSSRTRVMECALGNGAEGQVHLFVPDGEPKNATVISQPREGSIAVASATLDDLLRGLDRVDLVKIDAEGAEADILTGMAETITRHGPRVLLEFNAARYSDALGFVKNLRRSFAEIRSLDFNSDLQPVTDHELLGQKVGEDQLLLLEPRQ